MVTKADLESDMKAALRAGDKTRLSTLRLALSGVKLLEVERQHELSEDEVATVLQKEAKSRRETMEDAKRAGRQDIIDATQAELEIIESYLPSALSDDELTELAQQVITDVQAAGPQDMGKVMSQLMPRLQGRADGKAASQIVRRLLAGD